MNTTSVGIFPTSSVYPHQINASEPKNTENTAVFTIFINCKDTGSLCKQLLHNHYQAISCGHMQGPEKKQGLGNLSANFDFINTISKNKNMSNIVRTKLKTYVCKAAFVALMRFLSEIFSKINKALVSCPCMKHMQYIRSRKHTQYLKTCIKSTCTDNLFRHYL